MSSPSSFPRLLRSLPCAFLLLSIPVQGADPGARVDFNFDIRPLLTDRCFSCHGPDDKARKGGLDLRSREQAIKGGKSGKASIVPGDAGASELIRRLVTTDHDDLMPPPESKLPALTPSEIDTFRRWIAQGAEFKEHWAFLPISNPPVPEAGASVNAGTLPIDRFVRARLAGEGLQPQPEASREILIRRLSLDLTGLPPTVEEIDAFLKDSTPNAYEKVVDRLLASPRYGEWMAVEWMDLARYADTYGYQADVDVDLSPWRDWVIRSFNDNLSWDRFITWQLAGDLLDSPTRDQLLATAFNRLHRQTNEGGSIDEEFRNEYVSDRVHTTGTAFLGLSLECARCHDHKYDPVSMRDYYGLAAYFNSIDESGLYSHFTRATPTPVLLLWEGEAEKKHQASLEAIRDAELRLQTNRTAANARFEAWKTSPNAPTAIPLPTPVAHLRFEEMLGNRTPDSVSTNFVQLHDSPQLAEGRVGRALLFSGDNSATVPHAGRFGRTDTFSFGLWIKPTERQSRAVVLHCSQAWSDSGSRGYELLLEEGRPSFGLIHFWPGNALAVRAKKPLPLTEWSHLTVTYDGSSRAAGVRIFRDGSPLEVEIVRDNLYKDIQHRAEWGDSGAGSIPLTLAGRFRDNGFKNGLLDELQVFNTELTAAEVRLLATPPVPASNAPAPDADWFAARRDDGFRTALAGLRDARVAENNLITPVREIMAMKELPTPRPTFVLKRGAYDAPADPVGRQVPERILPLDSALPQNRLGLARWLTDPKHPLTARVAVNRLWKLHFGRGLSATPWDLGAQGQLPSHPELLDWLAHRFIDSGWDRKAMHKLIVQSATYRQSSSAPAELAARDPENKLLARGPRHRLSAEQIRDSALAVSGLLVPTLGGPSVKPYQPPGVWEEAGTGKSYSQDKGDKLHRRSLYTFWRRTAPPPSMLTFDATSREVCTAKREITATPLQSLVLLNDVQFLEAARVLAQQLVAAHPDNPGRRIEEAFRRVAGRLPTQREREILARLHTEQLDRFKASPEAAEKYLALGEAPRDPKLPGADVAATAVLASALLNHDEFVTKR